MTIYIIFNDLYSLVSFHLIYHLYPAATYILSNNNDITRLVIVSDRQVLSTSIPNSLITLIIVIVTADLFVHAREAIDCRIKS